MSSKIEDKPIKIANIDKILGDVIEKTVKNQVDRICKEKDITTKEITPLDFAKDLKDEKQIEIMKKFDKGEISYAEMRMYC